jgi:hypothetical protein
MIKMGTSSSMHEYKNILQLEEDIQFLDNLSRKKSYSTYDNIRIILISKRLQDNIDEAYVLMTQCTDRDVYNYINNLVDRSITVIRKFNASSY